MLQRKINRKYIIQTRIGNSPTSRSVMFFFRTMSKMIFCCREGGTRNKTVYSLYFARRSLISNSPGYRYWTFKTTSPGSAFGGMAAFGASSASLIVMLGGQLGLYSLSSNVFFPPHCFNQLSRKNEVKRSQQSRCMRKKSIMETCRFK